MIETPKADVGRSVWRAVFESGAQFNPVTAALARLYQTTHPSKFEQEVQAWRSGVTDTVNDHSQRLQSLETIFQPRMRLSEAAQSMAVWLSKESPSAHRDRFAYEALKAAFPDLAKVDLDDAVAGLKQAGLLQVLSAMGKPIMQVTPTMDLYLLFDPVAVGASPQADAVELARAALAAEVGRIGQIAERLGWSPRRVNPALALLLPLVTMRSNEINRDYLTNWFSVGADERVAFRRLIEDFDQTQTAS